jgi:tetratricopeptide (TPR) repeat protein
VCPGEAAARREARLLTDDGWALESHAHNELRQAIALYERAIALDPEADKPHYQLIGARAALREQDRALDTYEARLAASPGSLREYRFLTQALLMAHSYARALEVAGAGLSLAPADAALTASFLLEREDRPEESAQAWQAIIDWNDARDHARESEWPRRELARLRAGR